jgi:hypothetical protein
VTQIPCAVFSVLVELLLLLAALADCSNKILIISGRGDGGGGFVHRDCGTLLVPMCVEGHQSIHLLR